jgi:predicted enzyme involved in methoxymalonyl-ACP biosynthesis
VAIAEAAADGWHLDTLLMSCRVLGRGVETAFLAGVATALRASAGDPAAIIGTYVPTAKNAAVSGLYAAHGFDATGDDTWTLPADRSIEAPAHISTGR